jgi:hypothetical protein
MTLWRRLTLWLDTDVEEASLLMSKYRIGLLDALAIIRRHRKSGQHPSTS